MQHLSLSQFERRILLVVSGMSPQILTETLFALSQSSEEPFVPTEVYLLTTASGARNAKLHLLDNGHFFKLCNEYGLNKSIFDAHSIRVIEDGQGRFLEDIRTPEENEAAADYITRIIKNFTQENTAALHVSMAGGRKTMGYYAGYALSLFAREQDRLSHVLVSEQYEGLPHFFYPTKESFLIEGRGVKALDAKDAVVTLAEIPFVRLRNEIPTLLLTGKASFKETINRAQRLNAQDSLVIDIKNKTIIASGELIKLPPLNFAYYAWFVHRLISDKPHIKSLDLVEGNMELAEDFLCLYETIEGEMGKDLDGTKKALKYGMDKDWFDERNSRVNKNLKDQLGEGLAKRYQILGHGKRGYNYFYSISIDSDSIILE